MWFSKNLPFWSLAKKKSLSIWGKFQFYFSHTGVCLLRAFCAGFESWRFAVGISCCVLQVAVARCPFFFFETRVASSGKTWLAKFLGNCNNQLQPRGGRQGVCQSCNVFMFVIQVGKGKSHQTNIYKRPIDRQRFNFDLVEILRRCTPLSWLFVSFWFQCSDDVIVERVSCAFYTDIFFIAL